MKEKKQVIEVEFDELMVKEDTQAQQENNEELLVQDSFNTDEVEDMLGEGAEIIEE